MFSRRMVKIIIFAKFLKSIYQETLTEPTSPQTWWRNIFENLQSQQRDISCNFFFKNSKRDIRNKIVHHIQREGQMIDISFVSVLVFF